MVYFVFGQILILIGHSFIILDNFLLLLMAVNTEKIIEPSGHTGSRYLQQRIDDIKEKSLQ